MSIPIRYFETPNQDLPIRLKDFMAPRQSMRVLVVDDDPNLCALYELALEGMACGCDTAKDGKAALDLCAQNDYDVILMDYQMPGMNGCETAERIRCSKRNAAVPIIGCTADEETRDRCFAAGMNAFIVKPLSIIKLTAVLSHFAPKTVSA